MKTVFNKKIFFGIMVSFVFFFGVNVLAVTCPEPASDWDNSTGVCIPKNTGLPEGNSDDPVAGVIENVMLWLLRIVGVIAIIAFVISGIQYLTSAGNEGQIETAKRNMKWSIVGVIVALMGLIILNFVYDMLGGSPGGENGDSSTSAGSSSETWTGLPYHDTTTSASRGENIVNSAINNSATTVPNSPLDSTGLPIAN